jgi:uncharacterized membrane protein YdbT with pleckstrin-like domain
MGRWIFYLNKGHRMREEKKNYSGGIGFTGLLTIVFITLKLCKVIDWSWVWVLSPVWITLAIAVVVIIAVILFLASKA